MDVTNPNLGGVLTVAVSALPCNGGQPITDYRSLRNNGSTPISTGLDCSRNLQPDREGQRQTCSYVIAAQNSLGIGPVSTPKPRYPLPVVNPPGSFVEDPLGFRGWSPSADHGTTYDFLVDPAGGRIPPSPGHWGQPRLVVLSRSRPVSHRSGHNQVGRDAHTGPTSPSFRHSRTSPALSSAGGDPGSRAPLSGERLPVYKTGIAKASVPVSDLLGINVMENLLPISNAQDRADKTFLFDREDEATYTQPGCKWGNFNLTNAAITSIWPRPS